MQAMATTLLTVIDSHVSKVMSTGTWKSFIPVLDSTLKLRRKMKILEQLVAPAFETRSTAKQLKLFSAV